MKTPGTKTVITLHWRGNLTGGEQEACLGWILEEIRRHDSSFSKGPDVVGANEELEEIDKDHAALMEKRVNAAFEDLVSGAIEL